MLTNITEVKKVYTHSYRKLKIPYSSPTPTPSQAPNQRLMINNANFVLANNDILQVYHAFCAHTKAGSG